MPKGFSSIVMALALFVASKFAEEGIKDLWPSIKSVANGIDWAGFNLILKNSVFAQKLFIDPPVTVLCLIYVLRGNRHEEFADKARDFAYVLFLVPAATFMALLGINLSIGNDSVGRTLQENSLGVAWDAIVLVLLVAVTLRMFRSRNRSIYDK